MARRCALALALVLQVLVARAAFTPVTDLDLEFEHAEQEQAAPEPPKPSIAQISAKGRWLHVGDGPIRVTGEDHFESLGKDTICQGDETDKNLDGHGTASDEPAKKLQDCEDLCMTYHGNACQGFTYNARVGVCRLFPRAIGRTMARPGFECYRRKDAGAPEKDSPNSPIHWDTQVKGEEMCFDSDDCADGDEILDPDQKKQAALLESNSSVRTFSTKKWPDGVLKYSWDPEITPEAKKAAEGAFLEWEAKTCVQFQEAPKGKGVVNIQSKLAGCAAHVGYSQYWPHYVNLGKGCWSVGTAVHELGHALGLGHEHQRADAASFIEIVTANVQPDRQDQFHVMKEGEVAAHGVPYDLASIMHYGSHFFAQRRDDSEATRTIRVKRKDAFGNCQVGQRNFLSSGDILTFNRWYGCPNRFCADLNEHCKTFESNGYCKGKYTAWMEANCPHSCKVCTCEDESENCPSFASRGYCTRGHKGSAQNKAWMDANCRKSCGRCSHDDKGLCKDEKVWDDDDGCEKFKDRVYEGKKMCEHTFFRDKCPKACNLCPHVAFCW